MHISVALLTGILLSGPEFEVLPERPVPMRLAGGKFEAELRRPITAAWQSVPLRSVLRRIADERQVTILLDRRIDPTREIAVDFAGTPLAAALETLASQCDADVRAVANAAYVGPSEAAAKVRTLMELRRDELVATESAVPTRRQFELSQRRTIHWNDLDRPEDILRTVGSLYSLEVAGLERIPHDLWAGATLPEVTAGEALSLVLIQFDLTFAWTDRGEGLRIVPAPERPKLERRYRPRGQTAMATAVEWREAVPGLVTEPAGTQVVVRGTAEQHDAVAELIRPTRRPRAESSAEGPTPVERRQFSLKIDQVPASALMKKLEESGIVFEYDAEALQAAGIDLDQPISLTIRDAKAEEFFRAVFEPLGLKHSIEGLTVRLRP